LAAVGLVDVIILKKMQNVISV